MPRRSTQNFSSEDAQVAGTDTSVHVYHCKYSGRHALTTDCVLTTTPRRRTDRAHVIDLEKHTVKLYTTDGGVVLLRRPDNRVERQHRYNVGKLPVMYKSDPEGRFLYVFNDALTEFTADAGAAADAPVPPSIAPSSAARELGVGAEPCVQISLSIEDRASTASLLKITADSVRVQMVGSVAQPDIETEVLEYFRGVLGVRLSQLRLLRGQSARERLLRVWGTDQHTVRVAVGVTFVLQRQQRQQRQQVYATLQASMPSSLSLEQ